MDFDDDNGWTVLSSAIGSKKQFLWSVKIDLSTERRHATDRSASAPGRCQAGQLERTVRGHTRRTELRVHQRFRGSQVRRTGNNCFSDVGIGRWARSPFSIVRTKPPASVFSSRFLKLTTVSLWKWHLFWETEKTTTPFSKDVFVKNFSIVLLTRL